MLTPYEVTVTYRLHAVNESDATTQIMLNRVEPETVDIVELPVIPTPKIDIVDF
jgi:hypothetical protein